MFISVLSAQDHNGTIAGAELDALIRDLYIKNNSVCIQILPPCINSDGEAVLGTFVSFKEDSPKIGIW